MAYSIELHHHRLAAWAAGTAARVRHLCRFKVEEGVLTLQLDGDRPWERWSLRMVSQTLSMPSSVSGAPKWR